MMISYWIKPLLDFNHFFESFLQIIQKWRTQNMVSLKVWKIGWKNIVNRIVNKQALRIPLFWRISQFSHLEKKILPNDWNFFESCTIYFVWIYYGIRGILWIFSIYSILPMIFPILITFTYRYFYFLENPDKSHFHLFI